MIFLAKQRTTRGRTETWPESPQTVTTCPSSTKKPSLSTGKSTEKLKSNLMIWVVAWEPKYKRRTQRSTCQELALMRLRAR